MTLVSTYGHYQNCPCHGQGRNRDSTPEYADCFRAQSTPAWRAAIARLAIGRIGEAVAVKRSGTLAESWEVVLAEAVVMASGAIASGASHGAMTGVAAVEERFTVLAQFEQEYYLMDRV